MNQNLLIIDAGSSKADWFYLDELGGHPFQSSGFNPLTHFRKDLADSIMRLIQNIEIKKSLSVHYYGAGVSAATEPLIKEIFNQHFPQAMLEVETDILGAARATCFKNPGLVCIAGTGSNACIYDGYKIVDQTNTLGYILGDEGSGSHLAKHLLRSYFYRKLPSHLVSLFLQDYPNFDRDSFLDRLYKAEMPNAYLASFTSFLGQHQQDPYIKSLILTSFKSFIQCHILPFQNYDNLPVHFIGSIGFYFQNHWRQALSEYQLTPGSFIKKPIDGLVKYHSER
jgi:N-acetylglucosamine kinase-like BadF-type ATPase